MALPQICLPSCCEAGQARKYDCRYRKGMQTYFKSSRVRSLTLAPNSKRQRVKLIRRHFFSKRQTMHRAILSWILSSLGSRKQDTIVEGSSSTIGLRKLRNSNHNSPSSYTSFHCFVKNCGSSSSAHPAYT